jgi:hypothetical protein
LGKEKPKESLCVCGVDPCGDKTVIMIFEVINGVYSIKDQYEIPCHKSRMERLSLEEYSLRTKHLKSKTTDLSDDNLVTVNIPTTRKTIDEIWDDLPPIIRKNRE